MTTVNETQLGNKRNFYIDYFKGLAMIMVILLHSIQMVKGLSPIIRKPILLGQLGVQLFFLCSGYLVMMQLKGKKLGLSDSIDFMKKNT